ncbi:MAG: tetratricopeptide repeat protein [Treponema sp.]|jgi:hypothetical protein|nr:tetratricopeptide repeat protein [Treponema sp.]
MIRKFFLIGIFSLVCILSSQGQETSGVFFPYVSQIDVEIRNNFIRLTWKDTPDIKGSVFVYRSEIPFQDLSVFPVPKEVSYGEEFHPDEAEKPGVIYYYVVASDEWGRKYLLPMPFTNMISITVGPENVFGLMDAPGASESASGSVPSLASGQAYRGGIERINVKIEGDRVILSFSGEDKGKNLILYRSISPIIRQEDLLSALIIKHNVSSPVIDYPVPGITYYYALIYEEDLGAGFFSIRPGHNITGAVQIPGSRHSLRGLPLPELGFSSSIENRDNAGYSQELREGNLTRTEVMFFPEDRIRGGVGEEYQLRSIVQGFFSLKEWSKAEDEFRLFLDLPGTVQNRAKARFYLGQILYFQGKPREALLEFLEAQKQFPEETYSWIQAVLGDYTGS